MGFDGFPLIIGWELTLQCNLRCRHCGSAAGKPRKNELSTVEALSICEQLPELLVQEVDFTGGEPFLRPDIFIIAEKLHELGIRTNILTHGYGYSAEDIARLKSSGISGAGISLDGMEQTHDYTRRSRGSYQSVMKTISLFQQAKLPFNVITTVNSMNVVELGEMYNTLLNARVKYWRLQGIIPMGRVSAYPNLQLKEKDYHELGAFIQSKKTQNDDAGLEIICSDGLQYIVDSKMKWQGCGAGIVTCGITADGRVKGCLSMPDELTEGNLRKETLWDIWFGDNSFTYNRKFTAESLGDNCSKCEMAMECKGGCSSSSYVMTGDFHNDPFCFYRIDEKVEPSGRKKESQNVDVLSCLC